MDRLEEGKGGGGEGEGRLQKYFCHSVVELIGWACGKLRQPGELQQTTHPISGELNVTTSMVGLKNGHMRRNLTKKW